MVEGLWSQFREQIVSSGAAVVANLTLSHERAVVIECLAKYPGAPTQLMADDCLTTPYFLKSLVTIGGGLTPR